MIDIINNHQPKDGFRCQKEENIRKTGKLRLYKVGITALAFLGFVLSGTATGWIRCYSYFKHKSLAKDIEAAHIQSVSEVLRMNLTGPNRGQRIEYPFKMNATSLKEGILQALPSLKQKEIKIRIEARKLAEQVMQIHNKIERASRGDRPRGGIQALRQELSAIIDNPLYQILENQDCAAINFLQFVAMKLIAANGLVALQNYGVKCLGELNKNSFSPTELACLMSRRLENLGFSYGGVKSVFYAACHPLCAIHSATSDCHPRAYNAAEHNPSFSAHTFKRGKVKAEFYFGPGITGNSVFEHAIIPLYKKFEIGELRFNFQDTCKQSEYCRIKETQEIGDKHPEVLWHALLGFDTKMKGASSFQFETPGSFFEQYIPYVKEGIRGHHQQEGHRGFDIPQRILSDRDVDLSLKHAEMFCESMKEHNPFWNEAMQQNNHQGRARMAKVMQLVTDMYLSLAILHRFLDSITSKKMNQSLDEKLDKDLTTFRISGACKQDIDRGVVENIALRLFFRWQSNPAPLTKEEIYEIAGAVFGRARLVDDRKIMKGRYEILDDLLRLIGAMPKSVLNAHALLKDFEESFSPKNKSYGAPFRGVYLKFMSACLSWLS